MVMSREEILRDYKSAKNRRRQVQILAELNCCSRAEIERILGLEKTDDAAAPAAGAETEEGCPFEAWLHGRLDSLDAEIRALEEKYRKYAAAIEVLGEYSEGRDKKDGNKNRTVQ